MGRMRGRALAALAGLCLATAARAEPVRIAHAQAFPPFAELKDGKSEGLAVDLLRAAAQRAGLEIALVAVPFDQLQRTLEDGRAQAIFPLAATAARRQTFDFGAPLMMTGGSLYVRAPEATPAGLAALAGKTVVTPRTGPLAAIIEKTAPEVKLVVTANYEESLARLMSGEADAAALNHQVGARLAARLYPGRMTMPQTMFMEEPFAVAVAKGTQADLLAQLDKGIAAIRADGSWQAINDRWMPK